MQRVRLRLEKGPQVRFISHLDLQRTLERALRRARLPLALSQGYNPHPRLSFASALAVGVTSEAEYVDVDLETPVPILSVIRRLQAALPPGLGVREAAEVTLPAPALAATIDVARYRLVVRLAAPAPREEMDASLQAVLARRELPFTRPPRVGASRAPVGSAVDLRPLLLDLTADRAAGEGGAEGRLLALVRTGSRGNLRPEDLWSAISTVEPLFAGSKLLSVHRLGLYTLGPAGRLVPPLDAGQGSVLQEVECQR